ncbi:hypothetical protein [Petrachloros mirabilis]
MDRVKQKCFVWGLLICLVLVNGYMVAPSVAHAAKHASHKAGTHSTGLCAWLCAAGQGIETSSIIPEAKPLPTDIVVFERVVQTQQVLPLQAFLRGPPLSITLN